MSEPGAAAAPPRRQWRRSRHSGSTGGQCVEVTADGDGRVRIRDSKDPDGPQIVVSAGCWLRCLPALSSGQGRAGDCLVTHAEQGWVLLRHAPDSAGPVLRFTPREWEVFGRGASDGEFDLTAAGTLRPVAPPATRLAGRGHHLRPVGRRIRAATVAPAHPITAVITTTSSSSDLAVPRLSLTAQVGRFHGAP